MPLSRYTIITYDENDKPHWIFDYSNAKMVIKNDGHINTLTITADFNYDKAQLWMVLLKKQNELRTKLKKFLKLWDLKIVEAKER